MPDVKSLVELLPTLPAMIEEWQSYYSDGYYKKARECKEQILQTLTWAIRLAEEQEQRITALVDGINAIVWEHGDCDDECTYEPIIKLLAEYHGAASKCATCSGSRAIASKSTDGLRAVFDPCPDCASLPLSQK